MKRRSWLLVVSAAAVAGVSVGLSSCARNSEVLADNPELRLTSDREGKLNPFFTPDGNHVIYTSGITGSEAATYQRICMVPAAGGPVRTILADSSAISAVCWLPDEEAILVRKEGMLQKIDLTGKALSERPMDKLTAVFDVAPSGEMLVRKFTGASFDIGLLSWETGQTEILAPTEQWEFQACFGPGDDDITVMAHTEYGEANSSMQVFNRKRGAFTKLPVQEAPLAGPAWSEKGEYLAYSMEGDEATNLWLLESATGRLVQLTTGVEDDMSPSWSPDGEQVAFLRQTTTSHIRIADPVTHEATVISDGEDFDLEPLTSPDGEWISFVRIHNVGHGERMALCVAPTEGGTVRELDLGGLRAAQVGPRGA